MQSSLGTLSGVAEVRDKEGNLKGTFTFQSEGTKEQYEQAKQALGLKEKQDGDHSRNSNP